MLNDVERAQRWVLFGLTRAAVLFEIKKGRCFTRLILTQDFVHQQLEICPASFHKQTDFRPRDF